MLAIFVKVHLINLGKTLSIKEIQRKNPFKVVFRDPLVIRAGKDSYLALLKYGVAAFWNMTGSQKRHWKKRIIPYLTDPHEKPLEAVDSIAVHSSFEGIKKGKIYLKTFDPLRVSLVSVVLGRSLALEYYEIEIEKVLKEFSKVVISFGATGTTKLSTRELLKRVGYAMQLKHLAVSEMALLDKPDITWENPELEHLYYDLSEDFELEDRYGIITQKLKLIFQNIEFILNVVETRRSLLLEAIIVGLIVIEIVLFVYELWK